MHHHPHHSLSKWTPDYPPIYDIHKTYLENLEFGPFFNSPIPERSLPPRNLWTSFLGHDVATRVGVPAGPLLGSKWITLASRLGFDVLTYKTIRSRKYPAHPLPNMVYVDVITSKTPQFAMFRQHPQKDLKDLGVTNSFGMPSMSKDYLEEDIDLANRSLLPGQVMVVSVVGTPVDGEDFFADFVDAACFAKDAGAKIIEANFSCPNVCTKEGSIYSDASSVYTLGKKIVEAIHPIPLIIKMGIIENYEKMKEILLAAARAKIQCISGINTISMQVRGLDGKPALGENRLTSGICGGPIRETALRFVKQSRKIIEDEKLDLTLIGVGGITEPQHFDQFFNAGADFAQTATGMMWDPFLALRYHHLKQQ